MTSTPLQPHPPGIRGVLREVRSVPRVVAAAAVSGFNAAQPLGDVGPIVVVPGWATGDRYMAPLRAYLRKGGADVHGWGLGLNFGRVSTWIGQLSQQVREHDRPVHLIGWSAGGLIVREVARTLPSNVGSVITLGTPVVGGARYTVMSRFYPKRVLDRVEQRLTAAAETPIEVPVTAIYSRNDGIVDWRAMIPPETNARTIEVSATHWRLPFDRAAWKAIVGALERV